LIQVMDRRPRGSALFSTKRRASSVLRREEKMGSILDRLSRDHRNMRVLLELLEENLGAHAWGEPADFDLLRLIADYMLEYPDRVHHPLEELLLARLAERDPTAVSVLGGLMEEHRRLTQLTRRLAATIDNLSHDAELPRDWLAQLVQQVISTNRQHMQAEERTLFPRALARLLDDDWAALEARAAHPADPLFGESRAAPYLALHERILRMRVTE
jgi:hemerythrin-like domain-containing protein